MRCGLRPTLACALLIGAIAVAQPCAAKILKTKRGAQGPRELALTVGSGFEYETDSEQTEYGFPFLVQYGISEALEVGAEPTYVSITSTEFESAHGFGDLEIYATFEFVSERRNRPALAALGIVKWPTASHDALSTGEHDYSLGMIASKDFVRFDLDCEAIYTFVGSPPGIPLKDTIEASLAVEWHIGRAIDIEGEILTSAGAGGFHGRAGSIGGLGSRTASVGGPEEGSSESEAALGVAEQVFDRLKLEQGAVMKSDGSWQLVVAWEWNFGEPD